MLASVAGSKGLSRGRIRSNCIAFFKNKHFFRPWHIGYVYVCDRRLCIRVSIVSAVLVLPLKCARARRGDPGAGGVRPALPMVKRTGSRITHN